MFKLILSKIPRGQLARSATISLCWQFTRIALLAGWVVLIARSLGPQGYGQFSGIAGLAVTLGSFTGLGSGLVMYQDAIRNPALFSNLWNKTFKVTVLSGLLFFGLFNLAAYVLFTEVRISTLFAIGASEVIFYPLMTASAFAFAAKRKIGWSAALPSIMASSRFIALILFLFLNKQVTVDQYTWYHLGATVVASALVLCLVVSNLRPQKEAVKICRQEIYKGLSFCVSWASASSLLSMDKSLVLKIGGAEMAGLYSSAFRWTTIFIQPIDALVSASMPRLFRHDMDKLGTSTTIRYLFIALAIYGVISGSLLWASSKLIVVVLGPEFAAASEAIKWLSLLIPCYGIRALTTNILMTSNRIKLKIAMECSGIFLLFSLAYLLIPSYGLKGGVMMLITTEAVLAIAGSLLTLNSRKGI